MSAAEPSTPLSAEGVSALASFIIRPPRARYSRRDLGHRRFHTENPRPVAVVRTDLQLVNARGQTLQCSHYIPLQDEPPETSVSASQRARGDADLAERAAGGGSGGGGGGGGRACAMPAVVFLHGNGSCRVEAEVLFDIILPYGMSVFSFDFSGSGRSDGQYISLGVFEMYDVETVVSYLSNCVHVSSIALWGHSMGAATAAMYAGRIDPSCTSPAKRWRSPGKSHAAAGPVVTPPSRPTSIPRPPSRISRSRSSRRFKTEHIASDDNVAAPSDAPPDILSPHEDTFPQAGSVSKDTKVKALVLDSAFASFERLAEAMVETMPLPPGIPKRLILSVGVRAVRKAVKDEAGFDVYDIDPLSACRNISKNMAAILFQGTLDEIVHPQHAEMLLKAYSGTDKELVVMENIDHEAPRPGYAMERAFVLLQRTLFDSEGASSMRYVEALKTRGNDVMVDGRFRDAIFLYSNALDALVAQDRFFPKPAAPPPTSVERDSNPRMSPSANPDPVAVTNRSEFGLRLPSCDSNEWPESTDGDARDDARGLRRRSKAISTKIGDIFTGIGRRVNTGLRATARKHMSKDDDELQTPSPNLDEGIIANSETYALSAEGIRTHRTSLTRGTGDSSNTVPPERVCVPIDNSEKFRLGRMPTSSRGLRRVAVSGLAGGQGTERVSRAVLRRHSEGRGAHSGTSESQESVPRDDAAAYLETNGISQERKHVALALLGNRSLAKLRMREQRASLDDAEIALKLDPSWIRGYQRKASALKALGLISDARSCVAEGLNVSPTSATLLVMSSELDALSTQEDATSSSSELKDVNIGMSSKRSPVLPSELSVSGSKPDCLPGNELDATGQSLAPSHKSDSSNSPGIKSVHLRPETRAGNHVTRGVEAVV